jgi:hypothetical protein
VLPRIFTVLLHISRVVLLSGSLVVFRVLNKVLDLVALVLAILNGIFHLRIFLNSRCVVEARSDTRIDTEKDGEGVEL